MDDRTLARLREALSRAEALGTAGEGRTRWEEMTDAELERVAREPEGRVEDRREALAAFVQRNRTEKAAGDLLLDLLDAPEEAMILEAIRLALPFDARVLGRLRRLLDDPRPTIRAESARALGRRKDRAALPVLRLWFRRGDAERRRLALEALGWLLYPDEWKALLVASWEAGPRDAEERVALAAGLLGVGDARGLEDLREAAGGEGPSLADRAREALRRYGEG